MKLTFAIRQICLFRRNLQGRLMGTAETQWVKWTAVFFSTLLKLIILFMHRPSSHKTALNTILSVTEVLILC